MSGFENAIINAANAMIRAAIHSPNYVTGVSGWTINKDGSAEFNNLTIRGTFFGVNFVLNQNGIFFYDPTETLGNLILSIAPKVTTGPLGELVQSGIVLGKAIDVQLQLLRDSTFATGIMRFLTNNPNFTNPGILSALIGGPPPFYAMSIQGPASNTVGFKDALRQQFNSSDAVSSFANIQYVYVDTNGVNYIPLVVDGAGVSISRCARITADDPTTGSGPGNPGQPETWHDMRPLTNSFLGTNAGFLPPQFRKTADGSIQFAGFIRTPPTTGNYNNVAFANVPAAYRPTTNHRVQWLVTDVADGAATPKIVVKETGDLVLANMAASLAQTTIGIWGNYELENTGMILV